MIFLRFHIVALAIAFFFSSVTAVDNDGRKCDNNARSVQGTQSNARPSGPDTQSNARPSGPDNQSIAGSSGQDNQSNAGSSGQDNQSIAGSSGQDNQSNAGSSGQDNQSNAGSSGQDTYLKIRASEQDTSSESQELPEGWNTTMVSIKYSNGTVRPLVDETYYHGKRCLSYDRLKDTPHECIYHRICAGAAADWSFSCNMPHSFLTKSVYTWEEINDNRGCNVRMFCLPRKGNPS